MRILVMQDADWMKKGPHQQHHLIERLSANGHDVLVVGFGQLWRTEHGGILSRRTVQKNVRRFYPGANITYVRPSFIRIPVLDYMTFFLSCRREKSALKEFRPDVIISFTSVVSSYWGSRFASEWRIPFVNYWTDVIHTLIPFEPLQPVALLIERYVIRESTLVLAINASLKDYLTDVGADCKVTHIVRGGVNLDEFNPARFDSTVERRRLGISKEDFVVFYMGWIYEFSGLKEVVNELEMARKVRRDLKLVVVGEGDYYSQLRSIVRLRGLEESVIFTGRVPYEEIPALLSVADVCLLPARKIDTMMDIVPIKMYEYLAMHKPVISTNLRGIAREFGSENGVILVERPEDAIKKALELSEEDIDLHSSRAERFIKACDWQNIHTIFEDLLMAQKREN